MRPLPCWIFLALVLATGLVSAEVANLPALQSAAAKGDPVAQQELGRAYQLGQGVPLDYAKALDLYKKSAAQGNAKAMHNLGFMYHFGKGVTADDKQAAKWFLQAAGKDLPAAELAVGMGYRSGGIGLPKDLPKAEMWLAKAAGHAEAPEVCAPAANVLGTLYENGMDGTVKPDAGKAAASYKTAAQLNYAKGESNLGFYYHGHADAHGKKDLVTAYMWLRLASAQHETLADHLLADMMTGKELTQAQMAEGDARASAFLAERHLGALPPPPQLLVPGMLMTAEAKQKVEQAQDAAPAPATTAGTGTK